MAVEQHVERVVIAAPHKCHQVVVSHGSACIHSFHKQERVSLRFCFISF